MLHRGAADMVLNPSKKNAKLYLNCWKWLLQKEVRVFSFAYCCEHLELDTNRIGRMFIELGSPAKDWKEFLPPRWVYTILWVKENKDKELSFIIQKAPETKAAKQLAFFETRKRRKLKRLRSRVRKYTRFEQLGFCLD